MLKVELLKNIAPKEEQSRKNSVIDKSSNEKDFKDLFMKVKSAKIEHEQGAKKESKITYQEAHTRSSDKNEKKEINSETEGNLNKVKSKEGKLSRSNDDDRRNKKIVKKEENQIGLVLAANFTGNKRSLGVGEDDVERNLKVKIMVNMKDKKDIEVGCKNNKKAGANFKKLEDIKKKKLFEGKKLNSSNRGSESETFEVSTHKKSTEKRQIETPIKGKLKVNKISRSKNKESIDKIITDTERNKTNGSVKSVKSKAEGIVDLLRSGDEDYGKINKDNKKEGKSNKNRVDLAGKGDRVKAKSHSSLDFSKSNVKEDKDKLVSHGAKGDVSNSSKVEKTGSDSFSTGDHKVEKPSEGKVRPHTYKVKSFKSNDRKVDKKSASSTFLKEDGIYHLSEDGKTRVNGKKVVNKSSESKISLKHERDSFFNKQNSQDSIINTDSDKFEWLSNSNMFGSKSKKHKLSQAKDAHNYREKGDTRVVKVDNSVLINEKFNKNYGSVIREEISKNKEHSLGVDIKDGGLVFKKDSELSESSKLLKSIDDYQADKKEKNEEIVNEPPQNPAINKHDVRFSTVSQTSNLSPPLDKVIEHIDRILTLKPPMVRTILVKMEPPYIGVIHLKVSVDSQKNLSATLAVHDKDSYKAIINHLNSLKDYLQSNGFKVQNIDVHNSFNENFLNQFSSGSGGFQQHGYTPQNSDQPAFGFFGGETEINLVEKTKNTKVVDGVDLIV